MSLVFINYRGSDEPWVANWLCSELAERLGSDQVFLDNRSIPSGEDYPQVLLDRVRSSLVLVAVIGSDWHSPTPDGRLIDNERDWVRREIAAAFAAGVRVLPVLVGDVPDFVHDDLPPDIRRLARVQRQRIRLREAHRDIAHIVAEITDIDPRLSGRVRRTSRTEIDRLARSTLPLLQQHFGNRGRLVDIAWSLLRPDEGLRFVAPCRFSRRTSGSAVVLVTSRRICIADLDGELKIQQVLTFGVQEVVDIEVRRRRRAGVFPTADLCLQTATGDRVLIRDLLRPQVEALVDVVTNRVQA
ncbi:toll/interleukin-1 receptor domain-containing protein [Saccharothrix sp. 6-C]|uniref:toll/interleukin-1 receptor domain-containing protein n=1 Tax=Saccharothrix sp. 6-C TaxID=2781735 RepID=UPI001916E915|nr:toll/interleukin-1 receptor domain-containing protein [Saccharothrix sp. 6-C]QQQ77031.1 toll/interleukin-1 receptor domain-containing protein [Saccharothrix sp. 6-C]